MRWTPGWWNNKAGPVVPRTAYTKKRRWFYGSWRRVCRWMGLIINCEKIWWLMMMKNLGLKGQISIITFTNYLKKLKKYYFILHNIQIKIKLYFIKEQKSLFCMMLSSTNLWIAWNKILTYLIMFRTTHTSLSKSVKWLLFNSLGSYISNMDFLLGRFGLPFLVLLLSPTNKFYILSVWLLAIILIGSEIWRILLLVYISISFYLKPKYSTSVNTTTVSKILWFKLCYSGS